MHHGKRNRRVSIQPIWHISVTRCLSAGRFGVPSLPPTRVERLCSLLYDWSRSLGRDPACKAVWIRVCYSCLCFHHCSDDALLDFGNPYRYRCRNGMCLLNFKSTWCLSIWTVATFASLPLLWDMVYRISRTISFRKRHTWVPTFTLDRSCSSFTLSGCFH